VPETVHGPPSKAEFLTAWPNFGCFKTALSIKALKLRTTRCVRKGQADTALRTADSGYLTRRATTAEPGKGERGGPVSTGPPALVSDRLRTVKIIHRRRNRP
jgi:hypothetical protein